MERSRRGKLHKAKTGQVSVLAGAPYGYVYIPVSDSGTARYEIHPDESLVIRKIFELYTQEKQSMRSIVRYLNDNDIPPNSDKGCWYHSRISYMLRNPAYMGKADYRKTCTVPT